MPPQPQTDTELLPVEPESISEQIENETTSADSDKGDNSSLDMSFFDEAEVLHDNIIQNFTSWG